MRKSFGYSFVRSSLLLIYVTILSVGGCRASNARVVNKIRIEKKVEGSDFKYLGYRISEYKSDLEDKLQTYNKINGAIRRHFGKQTNKETKLRI
jgi:hypothetical protein